MKIPDHNPEPVSKGTQPQTMSKHKILVVDDEADIREMIQYNLEREGFDVLTAADGESALKLCKTDDPDLVILDIMLPGIDGQQVCYKLKADEQLKHIPVIMLTAKVEETDEIVGLKVGADDYVKKPFSPRLLLARIESMLRRQMGQSIDTKSQIILKRDDLVIDTARHEVRISGKEIKLTRVEFNILMFLAKRPGWVFSRHQIIEEAIGEDVYITERTIDVHIAGLRKKLGSASFLIETVHGVGYKFRG